MVSAYFINFTDPEVPAFNINAFVSNGPVAPITTQLSSTAVAANTSLLLYGKGHPEYGERIQENLVNIMENFSGSTQPVFPVSGQTWFDRITYVATGSPRLIWRWEDDSANPAGGSWIEITLGPGGSPSTADTYQVAAGAPLEITDGSFWLQTPGVGSPSTTDLLYIGVNNTTNNLFPASAWLLREMDDLRAEAISDPNGGSPPYLPQKQLKVYDGFQWKNSGNVYTSRIAPQNPADGDLWFQTGPVGTGSLGSPLPAGGSPRVKHNEADQLFIWNDGQWKTTGYVDSTGDIMTGPLAFGLPTPSLFLWEGRGDSTVGPDLRGTGGVLLTAETNFFIHFDDDDTGTGVFEISRGAAAHDGSGNVQTDLFRVQFGGQIRSLLGGSPLTYTALVVSDGSGEILTNKGYVVDVLASAAALVDARLDANRLLIDQLNATGPSLVGSPIVSGVASAKVNRIGDTMTGPLVFSGSPQNATSSGSPGTFPGTAHIDMGGSFPGFIDNLANNIINMRNPRVGTIGEQDATTRSYVDTADAAIVASLGSPTGSAFADGVVISQGWDPVTRVLTLVRSVDFGSPQVVPGPALTHTHPSTELLHAYTAASIRDIVQSGSPTGGSPQIITQASLNEELAGDHDRRLDYLEQPVERELFVIKGSPSTSGSPPIDHLSVFGFVEESYIAGTNTLQLYVNGVKQYANQRALQRLLFETSKNLSETAPTGLVSDATVYSLSFAIDAGAGSPLTPTQTVSAPGSELRKISDIIDLINSGAGSPSLVTARWNAAQNAISFYSNTTGAGSSVNILECAGSPCLPGSDLLAALDAVAPTLELPIYTLGNVSPAFNVGGQGAMTNITADLAYYEVQNHENHTGDARYAELSASWIFNAPLVSGDIIEALVFPAFFGSL